MLIGPAVRARIVDERAYEKALFKYVLNPVADATEGRGGVSGIWQEPPLPWLAYTAEQLAAGFVHRVREWHERRFGNAMRRWYGQAAYVYDQRYWDDDDDDFIVVWIGGRRTVVPLPPAVTPIPAPLSPGGQPPFAQWVQQIVNDNVSLIKSIPESYHQALIRDLIELQTQIGTRPDLLAKLFRDKYKIAGRRLNLLTPDQNTKFVGELNRRKQTGLGIERYQWQTMLDERVRPSHAANEGQIFYWDAPPATGPPGYEVNCRCVALAVIEAAVA